MQFLPSLWLAAWTGVWAWFYWRHLQHWRWPSANVRIEGFGRWGGDPLLKLRVLDGPFSQAESEMYLSEDSDLADFAQGKELLVKISPKDGSRSFEPPTMRELCATGFVFATSLVLTAVSIYLYS